jgi:hypothetical protein
MGPITAIFMGLFSAKAREVSEQCPKEPSNKKDMQRSLKHKSKGDILVKYFFDNIGR